MQTRLEKKVFYLQAYCVCLTLIIGSLLVMGFTFQQKQKFDEIDVGRINIVEKDGKLRMVISNQERQHPGIVNGKVIERTAPRPPGMIFFNHLGDEMGGLIFGENGGNGHFGSLTWDKVKGDQTIGFRHLESDNGTYQMGLEMWQQPAVPGDILKTKIDEVRKITNQKARKAVIDAMIDKNELPTNRLFLGKQRDNSTTFIMNDIKGKPRIRMEVAPDGKPKLDFLDETGKVTYSLPGNTGSSK
ncbi:MAG: hypothetical protein WKF90_02875 [Pyrinomonadaceae bacterium]